VTVTLVRHPSRADLYLVIEAAAENCTRDEVAELIAVEVDSVLCRPCRVRKRWNELVKVIDEA
jgi:hypothetical protein